MSFTVNRLVATTCLPCFCLLWTTHAVSATQRDLDSHEHGASTLDVVIDGSQVFIDFESPWMNLVGFEHQPATEDQLAQMESAVEILNAEPSQILAFNAEANCSMVSATVNSTVEIMLDKHGDEHHDEHGDEHSDEHGDEHGDAHQDTHSEVIASYEFNCIDAGELTELVVQMFAVWPGVEDIDVQLAGPGGQALADLSSADTVINLGSVR